MDKTRRSLRLLPLCLLASLLLGVLLSGPVCVQAQNSAPALISEPGDVDGPDDESPTIVFLGEEDGVVARTTVAAPGQTPEDVVIRAFCQGQITAASSRLLPVRFQAADGTDSEATGVESSEEALEPYAFATYTLMLSGLSLDAAGVHTLTLAIEADGLELNAAQTQIVIMVGDDPKPSLQIASCPRIVEGMHGTAEAISVELTTTSSLTDVRARLMTLTKGEEELGDIFTTEWPAKGPSLGEDISHRVVMTPNLGALPGSGVYGAVVEVMAEGLTAPVTSTLKLIVDAPSLRIISPPPVVEMRRGTPRNLVITAEVAGVLPDLDSWVARVVSGTEEIESRFVTPVGTTGPISHGSNPHVLRLGIDPTAMPGPGTYEATVVLSSTQLIEPVSQTATIIVREPEIEIFPEKLVIQRTSLLQEFVPNREYGVLLRSDELEAVHIKTSSMTARDTQGRPLRFEAQLQYDKDAAIKRGETGKIAVITVISNAPPGTYSGAILFASDDWYTLRRVDVTFHVRHHLLFPLLAIAAGVSLGCLTDRLRDPKRSRSMVWIRYEEIRASVDTMDDMPFGLGVTLADRLDRAALRARKDALAASRLLDQVQTALDQLAALDQKLEDLDELVAGATLPQVQSRLKHARKQRNEAVDGKGIANAMATAAQAQMWFDNNYGHLRLTVHGVLEEAGLSFELDDLNKVVNALGGAKPAADVQAVIANASDSGSVGNPAGIAQRLLRLRVPTERLAETAQSRIHRGSSSDRLARTTELAQRL